MIRTVAATAWSLGVGEVGVVQPEPLPAARRHEGRLLVLQRPAPVREPDPAGSDGATPAIPVTDPDHGNLDRG